MIKVSVVVPVYNPGRDFDRCIDSLLKQSLPQDEVELIFVDDGSTDETPAKLDRFADQYERVHVRHIPNSGWPGKPRNIGIDMAQGEFVFFVDNDDWLGPEALERLYTFAMRLGSDIVMGKVIGHGTQRVPRGIFRRNEEEVDLEWRPLLYLLSPHKLFRRAFLEEHRLRFPEGKRRLEDHVFVMQAYFAAQRISVLADYPVYNWFGRQNDASASRIRWDPVQYYDNVREVLDIVEQSTEPGPLRERLMAHWYRGKMLRRLGPVFFPHIDDEWRRQVYAEIRKLALERYGPWADSHVPFVMRVRAQLLREDRYDDLIAFAKAEGRLKANLVLTSMRRDGDRMHLELEGTLRRPKGPLIFERAGEHLIWRPPGELADRLSDATLDVTKTLPRSRADLFLRHQETRAEFELPVEATTRLEPVKGDGDRVRAVVELRTTIDPATAAAGAPLPDGEWRVLGELIVAGFRASNPITRRDGGRVDRLLVTTTGGRLAQRWGRPQRRSMRKLARRALVSGRYRVGLVLRKARRG